MKGTILLILVTIGLSGWSQTFMKASDLENLASDAWKGELMYKDVDTGEEVTIEVEMTATTTNNRKFIFAYHYPSDPKADNMVQFKVNGKYSKISSNKIISRKELGNGLVQVVTKRKGKDNHKKATLYYIYTFGPNSFSLATEVEYMGQGDRLTRSKYDFKK
ncbi:MAG: hypothetical protein R2879_20685 [Saprospiraceae bacterium]